MLPRSRRKRKDAVTAKAEENYSIILNQSESTLAPSSGDFSQSAQIQKIASPTPSSGNRVTKNKSENVSEISEKSESRPSLADEINDIFNKQLSKKSDKPPEKFEVTENDLKREFSGLFDENFKSPRFDVSDSSVDVSKGCCLSPRRKPHKSPRKSPKSPKNSEKSPKNAQKSPKNSEKSPKNSEKSPKNFPKSPKKSLKSPRKSLVPCFNTPKSESETSELTLTEVETASLDSTSLGNTKKYIFFSII